MRETVVRSGELGKAARNSLPLRITVSLSPYSAYDGRFRAVKIRNAALLFGGKACGGIFIVEEERENSIEEAWARVCGANIFVHGEIARAEPQGLLGRCEENVDQPS